MNIYVDEDILIEVLKAYACEQDWGDYGYQLDSLCDDILARNPSVREIIVEATKDDSTRVY